MTLLYPINILYFQVFECWLFNAIYVQYMVVWLEGPASPCSEWDCIVLVVLANTASKQAGYAYCKGLLLWLTVGFYYFIIRRVDWVATKIKHRYRNKVIIRKRNTLPHKVLYKQLTFGHYSILS